MKRRYVSLFPFLLLIVSSGTLPDMRENPTRRIVPNRQTVGEPTASYALTSRRMRGLEAIKKIAAPTDTAGFVQSGSLTLLAAESALASGVIDSTEGFVYFGTELGHVIKIRLSDFTRVGALALNPEMYWLSSAIIDPAHGFAYFGSLSPGMVTPTSPGSRIIKVRLSDLTLVSELTLQVGEVFLHSAVIDSTNGFAYFGTDTQPGKNRPDPPFRFQPCGCNYPPDGGKPTQHSGDRPDRWPGLLWHQYRTCNCCQGRPAGPAGAFVPAGHPALILVELSN